MQTYTEAVYEYPGGDDFSFAPENLRDMHLCHTSSGPGGSMEFQLCEASDVLGVRASWKNTGTQHDVLLNGMIDRSTDTRRVPPGECITLQACSTGWEVVR